MAFTEIVTCSKGKFLVLTREADEYQSILSAVDLCNTYLNTEDEFGTPLWEKASSGLDKMIPPSYYIVEKRIGKNVLSGITLLGLSSENATLVVPFGSSDTRTDT